MVRDPGYATKPLHRHLDCGLRRHRSSLLQSLEPGGLRVGVPSEFCFEGLVADVQWAVEEAIQQPDGQPSGHRGLRCLTRWPADRIIAHRAPLRRSAFAQPRPHLTSIASPGRITTRPCNYCCRVYQASFWSCLREAQKMNPMPPNTPNGAPGVKWISATGSGSLRSRDSKKNCTCLYSLSNRF
jgi:hypothetical protein